MADRDPDRRTHQSGPSRLTAFVQYQTCVLQSIDIIGFITSIVDFALLSNRRLYLQNNVYVGIPLLDQPSMHFF